MMSMLIVSYIKNSFKHAKYKSTFKRKVYELVNGKFLKKIKKMNFMLEFVQTVKMSINYRWYKFQVCCLFSLLEDTSLELIY